MTLVVLVWAVVGGTAFAVWWESDNAWLPLALWPVSVTVAVYITPVLSARYRRLVSDKFDRSRSAVVNAVTGVGGLVFVVLVALAATGVLALAPSFVWSALLSTAAWACFGTAVHGCVPDSQSWDWLRYTSAVVATSATGVVVLAFAGYQVWR